MLKKFSCKNYKSFKDEIFLDFSDNKDYKYNDFAIKNGLIHSAVIYGRNASGKSNFGLALFDITVHLIDKEQFEQQHINYLNADSVDNTASFTYEFIFDNHLVKYFYRKKSAQELDYEELYIDQIKVFSFNHSTQKGDFSRMDMIESESLNVIGKTMNISLIRYIANNANLSKNNLLMKMMSFVGNMLWYRSLGRNHYIGYLKGGETITTSIIKNGKVEDFQKYLHDMGVNLDLLVAKDLFGNEIIAVKFKQKLLPLWEIASSGTQVLTLHYYWSQKFSDVSFLFVDEFDAFYHTDLAEKILKNISQKGHFQSIFTTHNSALMTNNILRPDCYFILTGGKLNALHKCTERELREGHNLEKMYRNGEFIG